VLQPRQCSPIRDKCSWLVPSHLEVTLLVSQITTRCCARAFVYHLVLPCAPVIAHARRVRHSLCPVIQLPQCHMLLFCCCLPHLPLLLACPNQNFEVAGRHPIGLGTEHTLSPLVRVLVSFEHEANLFYTRHQNPYMVVTWGDLVGD